MCLGIHRLIDSPKHLQVAEDICGFYLTHPRPSKDGITPGKIAGQIAMALDLYDLTGESMYLDYARENADFAIEELVTNRALVLESQVVGVGIVNPPGRCRHPTRV